MKICTTARNGRRKLFRCWPFDKVKRGHRSTLKKGRRSPCWCRLSLSTFRPSTSGRKIACPHGTPLTQVSRSCVLGSDLEGERSVASTFPSVILNSKYQDSTDAFRIHKLAMMVVTVNNDSLLLQLPQLKTINVTLSTSASTSGDSCHLFNEWTSNMHPFGKFGTHIYDWNIEIE